MGPVHTALVKAKGVKHADVSFQRKQATVVYDPKATNPPALIKVVESTPHMMGAGNKYTAKVHK